MEKRLYFRAAPKIKNCCLHQRRKQNQADLHCKPKKATTEARSCEESDRDDTDVLEFQKSDFDESLGELITQECTELEEMTNP